MYPSEARGTGIALAHGKFGQTEMLVIFEHLKGKGKFRCKCKFKGDAFPNPMKIIEIFHQSASTLDSPNRS